MAKGARPPPSSSLFAGPNTLCDGNAKARASRQLTVAYPGVKVRCPKSAKPNGCSFKLQAIAAKPKRGKAPNFQGALSRPRSSPGAQRPSR